MGNDDGVGEEGERMRVGVGVSSDYADGRGERGRKGREERRQGRGERRGDGRAERE